ncbi:hypothetical protein [Bacillus dakarensis]|uniref:hypothetical protein n=1 Tax=Robertmurraya dakarensis TaxID=1926278 RepID=UPI0009819176|nr:hypothetical protein [Bacillus dakarensis]
MEEKSKDVQETEKIDPFTRFMFGNRRSIRKEQDSFESQNYDDDKDNLHVNERDWLFGGRGVSSANKEKNEKQTFTDYLSNVDYIELMHHVNTFMNSTKELKPLVNKLKPYLEAFLHKK